MDKNFNFEKAQRKNAVANAKGLAKWFSVRVEISVFGNVIWSYQYSPKES